MTRFICLWLVFIPFIAQAQAVTITVDTLWINKAYGEEDIDSYFPVLKSTKPGIAERINTILQMEALGFVLSAKNKAEFVKPVGVLERRNLSFSVMRQSDNLVSIDIYTYHFINAMSLNGYHQTRRYYFNVMNGERVHLRQLFTDQGFVTLTRMAVAGLRADFIETMRRYDDTFTANKEGELNNECECNCTAHLNNAFCPEDVRMEFSFRTGLFNFSLSDCDWMNPRSHDTYEASLTQQDVRPLLSPYGNFLLLRGAPASSGPIVGKLWKGKLGTKIPVTFFLSTSCESGNLVGLEIYDNYGTCITLDGKYENGNVTLNERDGDGKVLATYETVLTAGKLSGRWIKSDGTKTFQFEAVSAP
jgi:hypothetical protein